MATSTKKNDDLLADLNADTPDGVIDLLGEIDEEGDAKAWMPEAGEGVQGTVISLGTRVSDYLAQDGSTIQCPVVTLETAGSEKVRITAFQSVLRDAIKEANPQVGDLFAAKYFGKVTNKKGTGSYHSYKIAVRKATVTAGVGTTAKAPF